LAVLVVAVTVKEIHFRVEASVVLAVGSEEDLVAEASQVDGSRPKTPYLIHANPELNFTNQAAEVIYP
jgi:hypothetical protein